MYLYASYCPVAATTSVIGDYWTPLIVRELLYGTVRFNQLVRNLPSISRSLLSDRLRKLESAGIVRCTRSARNVTTYGLTEAGRDLEPLIDAMNDWGIRWGRREPNPDDIDPVLAICMLKDRLHLEALPPERVVVEVLATGAKEARAWIVCDGQGVSMCFDPPGFEVDLWMRGSVRALYDIWLQSKTFAAAMKTGDVHIEGVHRLVRAFPRWFEVPIRRSDRTGFQRRITAR
jgi:DNA-binding HxlR family transcriptional regulator